jgi:hypothetical protein
MFWWKKKESMYEMLLYKIKKWRVEKKEGS